MALADTDVFGALSVALGYEWGATFGDCAVTVLAKNDAVFQVRAAAKGAFLVVVIFNVAAQQANAAAEAVAT